MQNVYKIANLWLPPLIWAFVIFMFSSLPTVQTTEFFLGDFLFKKTAHIVEYGIFATLIFRALIGYKLVSKKAMWLTIFIACLYGISDEFHQSFTPGRGPSIRDVIIDTTGAFIFVFGIINNISKMPKAVQKLYIKLQILN